MNNHVEKVRTFTKLAGQGIPEKSEVPPYKVRELRARLILEEAFEAVEALGVKTALEYIDLEEDSGFDSGFLVYRDAVEIDGFEVRLEDIAKECADIHVVTTGTTVACGINTEKAQELVDNNNLDKFGPGHSFREDGKLIKPPGFKSPDMKESLV
jgi:predicted HAD superfamily Cof-like phosphohydrolase